MIKWSLSNHAYQIKKVGRSIDLFLGVEKEKRTVFFFKERKEKKETKKRQKAKEAMNKNPFEDPSVLQASSPHAAAALDPNKVRLWVSEVRRKDAHVTCYYSLTKRIDSSQQLLRLLCQSHLWWQPIRQRRLFNRRLVKTPVCHRRLACHRYPRSISTTSWTKLALRESFAPFVN